MILQRSANITVAVFTVIICRRLYEDLAVMVEWEVTEVNWRAEEQGANQW
jgi:hypothetical protein